MRNLARAGDGASLRDMVDTLLESGLVRPSDWQPYPMRSWGPSFPLDVYEDADNYYLFAALPGANPDSVEITALENTLTISGETGPSNPEGSRALLQEIGYGQFRRQVTLPTALNPDQVVATYEHGLFKLTAPKAPAHRQHRIQVQPAIAGK